MSGVGVLAVMDREIGRAGGEAYQAGRDLIEARAAVAGLVEAAVHAESTLKPWGTPLPEGERDAALARLREAIRGVR